jgi:DNA (cytosine-5)-methyltransferase 1
MRIVGEFTPAVVLIENVAGLLSSNEGRDMGTVVGRLGQLGYGWAYRVLDAQWFRVPQQRRRVFVVGCFGDCQRAAEILFERESLPWDSPPSREAGARVAATLSAGSAVGSGINRSGRRREADVNLTLDHCCSTREGQRMEPSQETLICGTLSAHSKEHGHAMTTQQAAESGQLIIAAAVTADYAKGAGVNDGRKGSPRNLLPIPFDTTQITSKGNYSHPKAGNPCHPLAESSHAPAVAFSIHEKADPGFLNGSGVRAEISFTLEARHHNHSVGGEFGVRRLMPIECERLQGFPDGWTEGHSDSARYRMIGNAVVSNVAEWIGRRILAATSSSHPSQSDKEGTT